MRGDVGCNVPFFGLVEDRVVGEGAGVVERVGDGRDVAAGIIAVPRHPTRGIGGDEHLSS